MNELQADFQKAIGVLMQFMFRLLPLALSKQLPEAEWQSFSKAFGMTQARMAELQAYTKASQSGESFDPKTALASLFAFKASLDELHGSLDKLLVLTGASEQERQSMREILVDKFENFLSQEEDKLKKALAALSDEKNLS